MRSEISSFKGLFSPTLLQKDIRRFWPLWFLYGALLFFVVPMTIFSNFRHLAQAAAAWGSADATVGIERGMMYAIPVLGLIYGLLCTMALFSYLMDGRATHYLHALPIRREGLFFTKWVAGLLFILVPNLVVALITFAVGGWIDAQNAFGVALKENFAAGVFTWLAVETAIPMFFYCFALCCAMFTGSLLALPVFYGILNMLVVGIYFLVAGALLPQLLAGYESGGADWVKWFTPLDYLRRLLGEGNEGALEAVCYCLVLGAVFTVIALAVYRLRHLERAGDLVTVGWVRPVFQVGFGVCVGLCLGLVIWAEFFGGSSAYALIALVTAFSAAGSFAARMLLKKTLRVFAEGWKGVAVMAAVLALLLIGVKADVFGYQRWTPKPEQVSSVWLMGVESQPYDSGSGLCVETDDPARIAQVVEFHAALVSDLDRVSQDVGRPVDGERYCGIKVRYYMKNKELISRRYFSVPLVAAEVDLPGTYTNWLQEYINTPEAVRQAYFGAADPEEAEAVDGWLTSVWKEEPTLVAGAHSAVIEVPGGPVTSDVSTHGFTPEEARMLWKAVQEDLKAGRIGRRYVMDTEERFQNCYRTDMGFNLAWSWTDENGKHNSDITHVVITVQKSATATLKALEDLGCKDMLLTWTE